MNDTIALTAFAPCKTCQHCSRLGNPPTCDILGRLVDPGLLYTCERAWYYETANHHFRACTGGKDHRASLRAYGLEGLK